MRALRRTALAVVSSFALFSSGLQAAESCWYPNEVKAAKLRDFHTMLMVGALQCRTINAAAVERYNSFVNTQRGLLDANSQILKAHFVRESGIARAQFDYDQFATTLANLHSRKGADEGFCSTVDMFARMGTGASQADLAILAQSLSEGPVSGACPPSNYASYDRNQPAPAVVEPAVLVNAPEFDRAVASVTPPAPALPTTIVASAPPVPPMEAAAPISRDSALQAAVAALQAATAALQIASSSAPAGGGAVP